MIGVTEAVAVHRAVYFCCHT